MISSLRSQFPFDSANQFSRSVVWLFATSWTAARQTSCPSPTPGACSSSCPSSRWCHPTSSSSVVPFSSYLQSFPASGSFPMSQFLTSGGQSIGASASATELPMNIQDWFPLGLTVLITLLSRDSLKSLLQHHSYNCNKIYIKYFSFTDQVIFNKYFCA